MLPLLNVTFKLRSEMRKGERKCIKITVVVVGRVPPLKSPSGWCFFAHPIFYFKFQAQAMSLSTQNKLSKFGGLLYKVGQ